MVLILTLIINTKIYNCINKEEFLETVFRLLKLS